MVEDVLAFLEGRVLPTLAPDLRETAHPSLPLPGAPLQPFFLTPGRKQEAKACWLHNVRGDCAISALYQVGTSEMLGLGFLTIMH